MNIFAIAAFITGILAAFFGILVYFKNRKGTVNQIFGLMSISLTLWALDFGFWQVAKDKATALLFVRLLMTGAIFLPIFYLHYVLIFLNLVQKQKKLLIGGYFLSLFFLALNSTSLIVKDVRPVFDFLFWPEGGIAFHFWLAWFLGGMAYGIYLLVRSLAKTKSYKKEQLKYVILASVVAFGGGITIFPLWYGIPILPFGMFFIFLYPLILAYAVLRYRLMDVRLILTEFLVVLIALVLLVEAITTKTLNEAILRLVLFFVFCFFGYLLIRSVLGEIKRRLELERLTQELKKAYNKLEELDKAKSEFLSIASHQLRTPLTAIRGYISMMLEKTYGQTPPRMKRPLENIAASNERLIKLVNDLLNVSRIESGRVEVKRERVSLAKVISSVIEELTNKVKGKGLYLKLERPEGGLDKISIDKDKLREVIVNILDNAIRYTPKGGIIIQIKNLKSKIQIIIKDTGEGMTKEEIEHLFESFSRGKAGTRFWTEGAGLGLYVAAKFVEMHKGKIWAESQGKNKGSTFFIELPIK